jgi:hypothetical protein
MTMPLSNCSIQNSKPHSITYLGCSITRSQHHQKRMAFDWKKYSNKEKLHAFIGRFIWRNSENLVGHNTSVSSKCIQHHP